MTARLLTTLAAIAVLLFTGFSTGSAVVLMPAALLILLIMTGFISVQLAAASLQVSVHLKPARVQRGQDVELQVAVRCRTLIPVAPMQVQLTGSEAFRRLPVQLDRVRGHEQLATVIHTTHVGVSRPGVQACIIEDLFGFFRLKRTPRLKSDEMIVLPQVFGVEELTFASGDMGLETLSRATEDVSSPSDIRTYAPGDPMKKIHWKLSLRKQQLLVRRFEEQALPEALILMDCAPPAADDPQLAADLKDTLLETAASLLAAQPQGHTLRLPLLGEHPVQLVSSMGLPLMLENLARVELTQEDRFERVLLMQGRRMSRVGCCVIITTHLSGSVVEAITSISRMGPDVRVYLISDDPQSERNLRYVSRLQHASIQVSYVTPLKA